MPTLPFKSGLCECLGRKQPVKLDHAVAADGENGIDFSEQPVFSHGRGRGFNHLEQEFKAEGLRIVPVGAVGDVG